MEKEKSCLTSEDLDDRNKSNDEKITFVLAPWKRPRLRLQPVLDVSPIPSGLHYMSCSVHEASEASIGDSEMAQAQLHDSEGSHFADCEL